MANVRVKWTLPTTRQSGLPLQVSDIAAVEIAQSADGGASFGVIDVLPPTTLETVVQDLEPGEWFFRGVVVDKAGRRSDPKSGSVVVPDETPPGQLLTLVLTLE